MRTYVILMRGDRRGSLGVLAGGSSGAGQQAGAIERVGGKPGSQYVVAGAYDMVVIAQFPSTEAMLAFCLLQNAFGLYAEPMEAIEPKAVDRVAELANTVVAPNETG